MEVLLDAVKILETKYPNQKFKATIAGTDNPNVKGYLDSIKKSYEDMTNVEFTGYVAEEDVERIFKESSFVIFPYTTTTGSSGILHQAGSYARACILPKIDDRNQSSKKKAMEVLILKRTMLKALQKLLDISRQSRREKKIRRHELCRCQRITNE